MKFLKTFHFLTVLYVTALFVSYSVFAQQNRWIFVGTDADGTKFYLDKTSRRKVNSGLHAWDKSIYLDGSFRINLVEWRCADKKYFVLDATIYNSAGSFDGKDKGTAWQNIIPDSISEGIYKLICKSESENTSNTESSGKMIAEVIAEKANIRAEPNVNSRVIRQAKIGNLFLLQTEKPTGSWYQIILPEMNETAWIHGNAIKLTKASNKSDPGKTSTKRRNKRQKSN